MNDIMTVSSSPHIRHRDTTQGIMLDVIIALIPATVFGCLLFGLHAVLVVLTTVVSAVAAECLWNLILKKPQSIKDLSAVVTGLLLGLNLPPAIPLWMAAIGSFAAIIVVKQAFGGLGNNFANPAIAARIILLVSFPSAMTKFSEPVTKIVTSATPLKDASFTNLKKLFFGLHSGCIGETAAFLLIIGGLYLVVRRVISPIIPVSFVGTAALLAFISGKDPLVFILSGGIMLGAIFMATDYTTSPSTPLGKLIFGIGCGVLTFVIRTGNMPEGVSYAILLMNILTPHIDTLTALKPFGSKEVKANE